MIAKATAARGGDQSRIDAQGWIQVWDPFVRVAHWLLVLAFFVAYLTEDELLTVHVWAGYAVGLIVLLRIAWGFFGTEHARFRDFLYRPGDVLRYALGLLRGSSRRYLGHSPAGGAMVLLLLIALAGTTFSGLAVYGLEEHAGPFASLSQRSAGAENGDDGTILGADEDFWEELHEVFANLALLLVILHIGGVLLASFAHKENLVRSMFTGRKRAP